MFIFGHLGIGLRLVRPLSQGLSQRAVLLGCLLPDLIDKPLYYFYGKVVSSNVITGTRTFGHTAILCFAVMLAGWVRKSKVLAALSLGMASHLVLDLVSDKLLDAHPSSALAAILFPYPHGKFGVIPFDSLGEHMHSLFRPEIIVPELLGIVFLLLLRLRVTDYRARPRR